MTIRNFPVFLFSLSMRRALLAICCTLSLFGLGSLEANEPARGASITDAESQPVSTVAAEHEASLALPSPIRDAPKSQVPRSSLFYTLPLIGFWLILRRRARGVRL